MPNLRDSKPPGTRAIGDYEILGRLSEGGMGAVYLARLARRGGFERLFAIKTIRSELREDSSIRTRFLDEARLIAQLNHTTIAQVFDFGESDGALYLVMEYIRGVPLSRLFGVGLVPLPPAVAFQIISSTCRGLHAAHSLRDTAGHPLGVVHRDVSPQNILLAFDGQTKLIDFGVALVKDRLTPKTVSGYVTGKPGYLSPEQLDSKPIDARCDVFACGIVLYELLTGERLFARDSVAASFAAVFRGDIPLPSIRCADLSTDVDAVVMKALERRAEDRYESAAAFATAIDAIAPMFPRITTQQFAASYLDVLELEALERERAMLSGTERAESSLDGRSSGVDTVVLNSSAGHGTSARARSFRGFRYGGALLGTFLGALGLLVALGGLGEVESLLEGRSEALPEVDGEVEVFREEVVPVNAVEVGEPSMEELPAPKPSTRPAGGRRSRSKRFSPRAGRPRNTAASQPKLDGPPAILDIRSLHALRLVVDDVPRGTHAVLRVEVSSGQHSVRFVDPETNQTVFERRVDAKAGETIRVYHR